MVQVSILLENSLENQKLKNIHGLSVFAEFEGKKILIDVGPNNCFSRNAKIIGIDIKKISALILSHAHYDHTGGLDKFCEKNRNADIFMLDNDGKCYSLHGKKREFIGLKARQKNIERIRMVSKPVQVTENSWLIPCTVNHYGTPYDNQRLLKKVGREFIQDDFNHEGIFVMDDNGELVIFNPCSHKGVVNSIESTRKFFPYKKVRSYVGGFHFPYWEEGSIKPEDLRNLEELIEYANIQKEIIFYTGHCTGDAAFNYLQNALGEDRIKHISTGQTLSI